MTITKDLFLSILSMDAYNRGYKQGLDVGDTSPVGSATYVDDSDVTTTSEEFQQSFYAVKFSIENDAPGDLSGKTVIAYRGTDAPGSELAWVDFAVSYGSSRNQPQFQMATEQA